MKNLNINKSREIKIMRSFIFYIQPFIHLEFILMCGMRALTAVLFQVFFKIVNQLSQQFLLIYLFFTNLK